MLKNTKSIKLKIQIILSLFLVFSAFNIEAKNYRIFDGSIYVDTNNTIGLKHVGYIDGTRSFNIDPNGTLILLGNVGIGISNPVYPLVINNNIGENAILALQNSDSNNTMTDGSIIGINSSEELYIWNYEDEIISFGTSSIERMRINSNGKVGIGTVGTNIEALLEIQGAEGTDAVVLLDADQGDEDNDAWYISSRASDNYLVFTDSNTTIVQMYQDEFGDGFLEILGDVYGESSILLKSEAGDPNSIWWIHNDGSCLTILPFGTTTQTFRLTNCNIKVDNFGSGTVTSDAGGNLTVSSDERLKNIEGKFYKGLDAIMCLEPIIYSWNEKSGMETQGKYVGFSAQEVQKVIPEAVGENKAGYLTLADRAIIATLVNAVQMQQTEIEKLKHDIEQLKIGR